MNNFCLVANYEKTYFFSEIALALNSPESVYWIVFNYENYVFLTNKYDSNHILYLPKNVAASDVMLQVDLKVRELVYGDRAMRFNSGLSQDYLHKITPLIYDFVKINNIKFVFGELTHAPELLVRRIVSRCHELGCKYLNPHTVRIPAGRFSFFEDEYQCRFYSARPLKRKGSYISLQRPDYFDSNNAILKKSRSFSVRRDKILNFLFNRKYDAFDPSCNGLSRLRRAMLRIKEETNKELYRFVSKSKLSDFTYGDYVFVALHKQPEASVDVLGRYYEDQLLNIVNIWRVLPCNCRLYVKEHPSAIGDRSLLFYQALKRLDNVYLLDEKEDSRVLIESALATFTISGTVAYEAALLKRRSFTFAPTFFNMLEGCDRVTLECLRSIESFSRLLFFENKEKMSREQFSDYLLNHSFEGIIGDPVSNPGCMSCDNIKRVADAFGCTVS